MNVLITGCSGLVGSALVEYLFSNGYSIQCLKRDKDRGSSLFWNTQSLPRETSGNYNSVIHLAGENVASGRWTSKKKEQILTSRVEGTRKLIDYISLLPQKPEIFICASAVGYYGNRKNEILDEECSLGTGFLADVCYQWETETKRLQDMGIRVVNLRFGMILSPNGGALQKMIPAFKMKLGGVVGSGKQIISWVSIRDVVRIVDFVIKNENIAGPVNTVTPNPTTNKDLTKTIGEVLQCPTFLFVPEFIAKLAFGQMAEEMLLTSCRAIPKVLHDSGFEFRDLSLDKVLSYCIRGE